MNIRLKPGQVVMTPGAIDALQEAQQSPLEFLHRHLSGDWGELCDEDRQANEEVLEADLRVLSAYRTAHATKLWIITEADRSVTTLLLPEEY
jgi:hypothetical protein